MKTKLTSVIVLITSFVLHSQPTISKEPLSPRIANYRMNVRLIPSTKTVEGTEILTWHNTSQDTIKELQFHMYMNAFKNTKSTFYKEGGHRFRGGSDKEKKDIDWGWVKILEMKDDAGNNLTGRMKYIQPDDDNVYDQTVLSVRLIEPVLPDSVIKLEINFKTKLPKAVARSGFVRDYFFVAQWFPKIGVYEVPGQRYATKAGWNCHQYHANTEFYADFGNYDVTITLPKEYIVGATGMEKETKLNTDGTKTVNYYAEDVVDFAWTASKRYRIFNDKWKHVKIKAMIQPEHTDFADRIITSVKYALEYFEKHVGIYPYTTVTIVDPPYYASAVGGMEYPTFFTTFTMWGVPENIRFIESTTVHEFGHNYFMGILATNEFEEAWMDEGFNTYLETRVMDHYYGEKTAAIDFYGFHAGDFELMRSGYTNMKNPKIAPSAIPAWKFPYDYSSLTYSKIATWMTMLERLVGRETMDEIMKTYYNRWKFKHPCATDFISIVNEVVHKNHGTKFGKNMNWFFDQVLYGTGVLDYKLRSIKNVKVKKAKGIFDNPTDTLDNNKINKDSTWYKSSVYVERLGEIQMPVEILVHFANGSEKLERWDGKGRFKIFKYEKPHKILWAKLDPANKLTMEINLKNNSLNTKPRTSVVWKYASKVLFWLENMMLGASMIF